MNRSELRAKFRIPAALNEISKLRSRLQGFLETSNLDFDDRARNEIVLALDEAASNIVVHGYSDHSGSIDVEYENAGSELVIRLWDDGIHRLEDDFVGLPPGVAGEGGMGLNIMRASMTSLSYEKTHDGRNLLIMRRSTNHRSWTLDREE